MFWFDYKCAAQKQRTGNRKKEHSCTNGDHQEFTKKIPTDILAPNLKKYVSSKLGGSE